MIGGRPRAPLAWAWARGAALALAALVVAPAAWAARAPVASGSAGALWVVAESPGAEGSDVHRLPASAMERGALSLVSRVHAEPSAVAAGRGRLVLLFAPEPGAGERRWLLRSVDAPDPRQPAIGPAPATPLTPFVSEADPFGLVVAEGRPTVLVHDDPIRRSIHTLAGGAWTPVALPRLIDHTRPWTMLDVRDQLALLERRPGGRARLWTRQPGAAFDNPQAWIARPVTLPPDAAEILSIDGEILAVVRADDELALHRVLPESAPRAASWTTPDGPFQVAPIDAAVAMVRASASSEIGFGISIRSVDGDVLFEGDAAALPAFSTRDLQGAALLGVSILLTVLAFSARPGDPSAAVVFPADAALATPARRAAGFLIDLLPSLPVVWGALLAGEAPEAWADVLNENLPAALFIAGVVVAAHSAVSEALSGRTLGKLLVGSRVIARAGGRPTWRQSIARNAVKVFCPPLALFVALTPAEPLPGSFGTFVVVRRPPDGDAGPGA